MSFHEHKRVAVMIIFNTVCFLLKMLKNSSMTTSGNLGPISQMQRQQVTVFYGAYSSMKNEQQLSCFSFLIIKFIKEIWLNFILLDIALLMAQITSSTDMHEGIDKWMEEDMGKKTDPYIHLLKGMFLKLLILLSAQSHLHGLDITVMYLPSYQIKRWAILVYSLDHIYMLSLIDIGIAHNHPS
ncbi:hypothetical protein ACJX0J_018448, partial [Zea mays]